MRELNRLGSIAVEVFQQPAESLFALDVGKLEARPYADFNLDGVIDNADFTIWKANFGVENNASFEEGDANGDGLIDAADYVVWRDTMGPAVSLGVFTVSATSINVVPEPTTIGLAIAGAIALAMRNDGRVRRCSNGVAFRTISKPRSSTDIA
jgi:hypothetical protein